jgi:hypothetical protein
MSNWGKYLLHIEYDNLILQTATTQTWMQNKLTELEI